MQYKYLITIDDDTVDYLGKSVDMPFLYSNEYIRYDFNNGFRILFKDTTLTYKIIILDKNTRCVYHEQEIKPENEVVYVYPKRYYIEYEVIILRKVDEGVYQSNPLCVITYNPDGKNILFLLSNEERAGLGDCIAWLTSVYKFKVDHPTTNIFVCTEYEDLNNLIKEHYECFTFIKYKDINNHKMYATYLVGCFYNDPLKLWCPRSYKELSLVEIGYSILGLEFDKDFSLNLRKDYKEDTPYVCIATHGSSIYKEWLFKDGWKRVVDYLSLLGYRVYIIDAEEENSQGYLFKTNIPKNAINKIGYQSLSERAKLISGAEFFIGISSGLSWLAWVCRTPVILISGFTNPITEFYTPYRVFHNGVCNSCWNDVKVEWDISNTVCPKCTNPFSMNFLECSTKISPYAVIDAIDRVRENLNGDSR